MQATWGGDGLYATVAVIANEMQRRGVDPGPLLAEHKLHAFRRWRPLERAPRGDILAFVDSCLELCGDPGMHIAATRAAAIGAFEIADYLAIMGPTVGYSLRTVCERWEIVNSGFRFRFEELPGEVIGTVVTAFEPRPHPVETECGVVAIDHRVRYATGNQHGLSRVELSHRDRGAGIALRQTLRCPVIFECPADRITLTTAAWASPNLYRHESLEPMIRSNAPGVLPALAQGFVDRVRRAVAMGLLEGARRTEWIAERLGMSARSLQRRLAEQGVSVAELVEEERKESALTLIADAALSLAEISERLGFSEPSAFTRAFRRWTGLSPSDYREQREYRKQRGGS